MVIATTANPPTIKEIKKLTKESGGIVMIEGLRCRIKRWHGGTTAKFNRVVDAYGKKWGLRRVSPLSDVSYDYDAGYVI